MKKNNLLKIAGVALALVISQSASALTISATGDTSGGNPGGLENYQVAVDDSDVGQSFDLFWNWTSGGDTVSASGSFSILEYDVSTGHFDLGFSLTNNSVVTDSSNPRVLSFGFNVDPNMAVNGVDFGGTNQLDMYDTSTNFPGFQTIDFCVYSQGCAGGNINTGLGVGQTDTFVVHMVGDLSQGLLLSDFAMKFQAIDSYELPGQPGCDGDCASVPEPSTALLLGIGLLGFGMRKRMKL